MTYRTVRVLIEVSVAGDIADDAVGEALFDHLVNAQLPEPVFSVDGWEVP